MPLYESKKKKSVAELELPLEDKRTGAYGFHIINSKQIDGSMTRVDEINISVTDFSSYNMYIFPVNNFTKMEIGVVQEGGRIVYSLGNFVFICKDGSIKKISTDYLLKPGYILDFPKNADLLLFEIHHTSSLTFAARLL